MGSNKWQTADSWPPKGAKPMTYYLSSGGKANTLDGDGTLILSAPASDKPDAFIYDPKHPVPSYGGNVCCAGTFAGGAMDQRKMETRPDILVYTTEPLKSGIEVSGPMEVTLYTSSDRKDTDFTVKVLDVYPDGRAYNLDETILRARYREGYDKQVWMESGEGVQGGTGSDEHEQLLRRRAPHPDRGFEQQLPALRPQPEHGRPQLRRGRESGGAERYPPLEAVSITGEAHRGEALGTRRMLNMVHRPRMRTSHLK
jgi:putative hydrolase, CocE/NonD family